MAKYVIQILGTIVMFAAIINGINGQCTASDFCCAGDNWTKPEGANDAFADCYIQGNDVNSTDCPTGWTYDAGGQWPAKCKKTLFQSFTSVKSCSDSNSCTSVENMCGNPTVRSGLSLEVDCVVQSAQNIASCPKGWGRDSCGQCRKNVQGTNYNATRPNATTCTPPGQRPDYSEVCEKPWTYNGSYVIAAWNQDCNWVMDYLSTTPGYCFENVSWDTIKYPDFAGLPGTQPGPGGVGKVNCSTVATEIVKFLGCCNGTGTPPQQEGVEVTSAATMTAPFRCVFMLVTILGMSEILNLVAYI